LSEHICLINEPHPEDVEMGGVVCVAIGGAINAYRVYGIMTRANDDPSTLTKGATGGVVMGAIVFGLPLWGAYSLATRFL
jgi:hypothetical protein